MQLQILHIRDIKADCCTFTPVFAAHIGAAIRDFGDRCKDRNDIVGKHPEDYELYHVGVWTDYHAGSYEIFPQPKQIAVGANYTD